MSTGVAYGKGYKLHSLCDTLSWLTRNSHVCADISAISSEVLATALTQSSEVLRRNKLP